MRYSLEEQAMKDWLETYRMWRKSQIADLLRPPVEDIIRFILYHFEDEQYDVKRILVALNLKSHNIHGKFKAVIGISIGYFLEEVRLEAAKCLIEAGLGCEMVGYGIGYREYRSFNRAFKKKFGFSPKKYRKG